MGTNSRKQQLHPTRIDISAETRAQVTELLNHTLASTLDLKTQVKQAHWNVKGMDFYQLHTLFDDMATELEEFTDLLAERVTALGGVALGTARIAASQSILPEIPSDLLDGKDYIEALADRVAPYGKLLREGIAQTDKLGDANTADLYTEVSRAIDKRLWFLEAHLQTASVVLAETEASQNGQAPEPKAATAKASKKSKK